ncbi:unnamed protein product [Symbiodinium sp. KB8]|nr:unnamed protein product [Symbiodinium sp. KB8]
MRLADAAPRNSLRRRRSVFMRQIRQVLPVVAGKSGGKNKYERLFMQYLSSEGFYLLEEEGSIYESAHELAVSFALQQVPRAGFEPKS